MFVYKSVIIFEIDKYCTRFISRRINTEKNLIKIGINHVFESQFNLCQCPAL